MEEWWSDAIAYVTGEGGASLLRAVVTLVAGLVVARLLGAGVARMLSIRGTAQQAMLGRRAAFYATLLLTVASALGELGFNMAALLGAAGVLTVAIGFASQTSAANIIAGLFLIGERPFVLGDVIRVGATTGEVVAIDLLSVKLRTFDNLYVRVPNELLIKSEIVNVTHFPIRRLDVLLTVDYRADVATVRDVLLAVARDEPLCLEEPAPALIYLRFGPDGQEVQLSVWAARATFLELKSAMHARLKAALDEAGVEIAFPQRSLHAVSSRPLQVEIVGDAAGRG